LARITRAETKPLAIVDSNIIVYAMVKDYPNKLHHNKCLTLLEKGLKGELDYILTLNPIIIVEVFSALKKLLNPDEAEFRVTALLHSRRLLFLSISKEACQNSVRWAKEKNIPVNDALIGANMAESADLIYTVDEDHFKKLEDHGIKIRNPTKSPI
jgi:predicted nucleic acid-binding protein